MSGAQRTTSRLFRHGEPIHPGVPAPLSPACPWCNDECDETHDHLFWPCEAFEHIRGRFHDELATLTRGLLLPLDQWQRTCRNDGLCPEDPAILECQHSVPREHTYPPLPAWRPPSPPFLSEEGKTLFAFGGGTDLPTVPHLRHSGVGIFGGRSFSWQLTSPPRGAARMKDRAELVAVVLAAEPIETQLRAFPNGVDICH